MTTETTQMTPQTIQQRLAAAERAVAQAHARAQYHGWSGAASNAYAAALRDLHAARRAARAALIAADRESASEATGDLDPREGVGAFGWAILSLLLLIGAAVGVYSAHVLR